MKKLLLSLFAVLALTTAVSAQETTIGLKMGSSLRKDFGMEISAQTFTNDINRIELDLGLRFRYGHTALTTAIGYQWHWFLFGGFGVYGGPAIQLGYTFWSDPGFFQRFNLGLGAQLGFDYQFDFPVQVVLDFRPTYNFFGGLLNGGRLYGFDPYVSMGLRYAF